MFLKFYLAVLNVGNALDTFFNLGNLLNRLNMVGDQGKIEKILAEIIQFMVSLKLKRSCGKKYIDCNILLCIHCVDKGVPKTKKVKKG